MRTIFSLDVFGLILNVEASIEKATKLHAEETGYIYLASSIFDGNKEYKIGCTSNLRRRLKTLESRNNSFKVICTASVPDHQKTERTLHRIFKEKRLHGEWFHLNNADIELFIDMASVCGHVIDLFEDENICPTDIQDQEYTFKSPVPDNKLKDIMNILQSGISYSQANLCGPNKPLPGGERGRKILDELRSYLVNIGILQWNLVRNTGEPIKQQGVRLTAAGKEWRPDVWKGK